jgi:hypothetical protein
MIDKLLLIYTIDVHFFLSFSDVRKGNAGWVWRAALGDKGCKIVVQRCVTTVVNPSLAARGIG